MEKSRTPLLHDEDFYRSAIEVLQNASIEFLAAGGFAMRVHADVVRDTKDFDVMLRPADVDAALEAFHKAGFRAGYAFKHWLAKVHYGEHFMDIIYRAGNGLCEVDDDWFRAAKRGELLGMSLPVCPPEEMIWQKAFIMERERFDGADIQHLLRSCAATMDWQRLVARFGDHWRVLFSHLMLFGYIYPGERNKIPATVLEELMERMKTETQQPNAENSACFGTLLSRAQYLADVERWGYEDPRRTGEVSMNPEELRDWTNAIDRNARPR